MSTAVPWQQKYAGIVLILSCPPFFWTERISVNIRKVCVDKLRPPMYLAWLHHAEATTAVSLPVLRDERNDGKDGETFFWAAGCSKTQPLSDLQVKNAWGGCPYVWNSLPCSALSRMCIKSLVDKSAFEVIADDCPHLQNMCITFEQILTHRIQCTSTTTTSDISLLTF